MKSSNHKLWVMTLFDMWTKPCIVQQFLSSWSSLLPAPQAPFVTAPSRARPGGALVLCSGTMKGENGLATSHALTISSFLHDRTCGIEYRFSCFGSMRRR